MSLPKKINHHFLNFACEPCAWFVFVGYRRACVNPYVKTFVIGIHEFDGTSNFTFTYLFIVDVQPTYTTCTKLFLTCLFKLKSKLYIFSSRYFFCRSHIVKLAHAVVAVCQPKIFYVQRPPSTKAP